MADVPQPIQRDWLLATTADYVATYFGAVIWGFDLLVLAYAVYHRNWLPLKAKQVDVSAVGLFAGICFWLGNLHATGITGFGSEVLRKCSFWGLWVQIILGVHLLLAVMNYRIYKLHYIIIQGKVARGWRFYWFIIAFYLPIVILGFAAAGLGPQHSVFYMTSNDWCQWNQTFKMAMIPTPLLGFAVLVWLNIALRNIRSSFNEYSEQRLGFLQSMITFICYCLNNGIFNTSNKVIWARVLQNILILLAGHVYFILIILPPVWGHLFHREKTLANFQRGMMPVATGVRSSLINLANNQNGALTFQINQMDATTLQAKEEAEKPEGSGKLKGRSVSAPTTKCDTMSTVHPIPAVRSSSLVHALEMATVNEASAGFLMTAGGDGTISRPVTTRGESSARLISPLISPVGSPSPYPHDTRHSPV
ncbi:hypothetical protein DFS34DRAFT_597494 [Phlyctochytrium arcticum]|nr:hypothetical protein DFS34DRAFT_597494 [Phlyctochytrium arcticum]